MIAQAMTLDELKSTASWHALSPRLRELLTVCFKSDFDMVSAVARLEPDAGADQLKDAARRVLADEGVRDVVNLFIFGFDSFAMRGVPFAPESVAL